MEDKNLIDMQSDNQIPIKKINPYQLFVTFNYYAKPNRKVTDTNEIVHDFHIQVQQINDQMEIKPKQTPTNKTNKQTNEIKDTKESKNEQENKKENKNNNNNNNNNNTNTNNHSPYPQKLSQS